MQNLIGGTGERRPRNPDNCAMYVLKKNTSSHAVYPYYMDDIEGDRPMSSIDLARCSGSH